MKLFNKNIVEYNSFQYNKWYSIKKHLINRFPDMVNYIVPTTLKGIGKSYSAWNEVIFDYLNDDKILLYIRWTKGELDSAVDGFKNEKNLFEDKLNFDVYWNRYKDVTVLRRRDNSEVVAYFVTPSQFKIIKGLPSKEEQDLKEGVCFWEEFLIPDGIYRKPKETIDSFIQVLGSLFRHKKFINIMVANNVNPDNPFMDYLFTDLGWPDMGKTIVDWESKTVIDSPNFNKFTNKKYENTALFTFSKLNDNIHKQLFGLGKLNDSIYSNQDLIIYRLQHDANFKFKFQLGVVKLSVLSYNDNGKWYLYITDQNTTPPVLYAGDLTTSLQTDLKMVEDSWIKTMRKYAEENKIRFKSVKVMNIILDWLVRYRDLNKPIDWSKVI